MKAATEERFWDQVDRWDPDECWWWTGRLDHGYGRAGEGWAHRLVYERLVGPIPDGLQIDHLCRNRACVNPKHMEPVTNAVNVLRGDAPSAQCARKTHCLRGHPFDETNTYVYRTTRNGWGRSCRECQRERNRQTYRRRMARARS